MALLHRARSPGLGAWVAGVCFMRGGCRCLRWCSAGWRAAGYPAGTVIAPLLVQGAFSFCIQGGVHPQGGEQVGTVQVEGDMDGFGVGQRGLDGGVVGEPAATPSGMRASGVHQPAPSSSPSDARAVTAMVAARRTDASSVSRRSSTRVRHCSPRTG